MNGLNIHIDKLVFSDSYNQLILHTLTINKIFIHKGQVE